MWGHSGAILFVVLVGHQWSTGAEGRQCGFPGRPINGSSTAVSPVSRPGDTAHYTCLPRFVLFGEEERVCLDSGIWAGRQPLCELNLSLERNALMSATLWNYRAALAVDGNPDTCSFTPRTTEQRWWQVDLNTDQKVGSVALIINKDSYQELTIFVVQLLSKSEALYKPCASFKGRFQNPRILFSCNKGLGHRGRYVYIRDDRKDQDYFGLCEVEAFAFRDELTCGEPEVPIAGQVTVSPEGTAQYACDSGYRLIAEPNRTCERDGHWAAHAPQCEEIQCDPPGKTQFGFPEVYHLKGKFPFDTRVTYKCQAGYVVWGNATRACTETGLWSGTVPQCKPITCGYPRTSPNSEVDLLNQSTLWNAVAVYSCKTGYTFAPGTTQVTIKCLATGIWEHINITCVTNGKRNLPVKLTGNEYGQNHDNEESHDKDDSVSMPGIIAIGIFCSLLIIMFAVLGIFVAKRFQSKKASEQAAASKSSTNDLIMNNAKDGIYDDVTPTVSIVVKGQPQCPPPVAKDSADQAKNLMPFFSRQPELNQYDTLHSLPSVSSYNSNSLVRDNTNKLTIPHMQIDGIDIQEDSYNMPMPHQDTGYETVAVRSDSQYETIHNLQHFNMDSNYEIVQPNGTAGMGKKTKVKPPTCSIPLALKLFLQSPSKQSVAESQLYNETVSPEILALYAQVDKTKKRNYKPEVNETDGYPVAKEDEGSCNCTQHPISDIACFSQQSCGPTLWNGNKNDCAERYRRCCNGGATLKRSIPVPPPIIVPKVRFLPQEADTHTQDVGCNQL